MGEGEIGGNVLGKKSLVQSRRADFGSAKGGVTIFLAYKFLWFILLGKYF